MIIYHERVRADDRQTTTAGRDRGQTQVGGYRIFQRRRRSTHPRDRWEWMHGARSFATVSNKRGRMPPACRPTHLLWLQRRGYVCLRLSRSSQAREIVTWNHRGMGTPPRWVARRHLLGLGYCLWACCREGLRWALAWR